MSALCLRAAVRSGAQWAAARLVLTRRVIWFSTVVSAVVQETAAEAGAAVATLMAAVAPSAAVSRAAVAAARRTRRVTGRALREVAWRAGGREWRRSPGTHGIGPVDSGLRGLPGRQPTHSRPETQRGRRRRLD